MTKYRLKRMEHVEAIADDIVTYRDTAEITGQALTFMRDAMVNHINDPALIAAILDDDDHACK